MAVIRKPKNTLKFTSPASWWGSTWREALPTGNGVIGAAVYGGASNDTVMIGHGDLWWQGKVGVLQDVADKIKDVRKKLDDNAFKDAENVLSNALITKGYRPQLSYPLPLCDFKINMPIDRSAKEYSRVLNMENGEISVSYKDGATRYDRSMFVSRAQNVIVYEITHAGSKAIDVTFSLDLHERFNVRTPGAVSKLPEGVNNKYEKYFMYFSARSDNNTEFGAVAFINHYGGDQTVNADSIHIKGADRVLVILKPFVESNREKEWKNIKTQLTSIKSTYEKMLKEHTPLHHKLFASAELDLNGEGRELAVDDLIKHASNFGELQLALYEKLWAYGRYLMVCASDPASLPCAPYGLWCGDYKAVDSQINAGGSLQTIYSHVLAGNLPQYLESVFTYYESMLDDLKRNASRLYACRGIFIPAIVAHGTGSLGSVDSGVIHFIGVAGWISRLFYDYALYTDDAKFLKNRALPFMREVALFYENFFKVDNDNRYEISPSYSPDTTPLNYLVGGEPMKIARNSTVDFAIAKELFTNLVEGSEKAGLYKTDVPKWKDMLTRMPDYQFNADGTVKEYIDKALTDNFACTSTAMFYPVYPGCEIGDFDDRKKGFMLSAKKHASSSTEVQTASTLTRYANIFARLGEGNTACEIITNVVRSMVMGNLVFASSDWRGMGVGNNDIWSAYTIEPNMAITSAMQEMLVQSTASEIKLLPALPEIFDKGEALGLLTRAGVEISSLAWDSKKGLATVKLKAKKAVKLNVKLPASAKPIKAVAGEKFNAETVTLENMNLPAGKLITLNFKY